MLTAIVVRPAPILTAARAAIRAAPVWGNPPKTTACPRVYLLLSAKVAGRKSIQREGELVAIYLIPNETLHPYKTMN